MKRIALIFLAAAIVCTAFTGCTNPKNDIQEETVYQTTEPLTTEKIPVTEETQTMDIEDFAKVVSLYEETFVPMDNDTYLYEEALNSAEKYVTGELSGVDTFAFVYDTMTELQNDKEQIQEIIVDEEMQDLLTELDIMPEEFEMFLNYREQDLNSYIDNLYYLASSIYYVENQVGTKKNMEFLVRLYKLMSECNKGSSFYININYWFSNCNEQQTQYLFEELGQKLKCYSFDDSKYIWENNRDIAEEKSSIYLDLFEECLDVFSQYISIVDDGGENLDLLFIKVEEIENKMPAM